VRKLTPGGQDSLQQFMLNPTMGSWMCHSVDARCFSGPPGGHWLFHCWPHKQNYSERDEVCTAWGAPIGSAALKRARHWHWHSAPCRGCTRGKGGRLTNDSQKKTLLDGQRSIARSGGKIVAGNMQSITSLHVQT
jgi:hypothetical protein